MRLLLDTHVWFWLVNQEPQLSPPLVADIQAAAAHDRLFVQAYSVWEICMLESKRRIELHRPIAAWVQHALTLPGLQLIPLEPAIAIESTRLPGGIHRDPADQILAATARIHGLILVTHDALLLRYARAGHLRAMPA